MKTICVMRDVFKAMARFEDAFEKVYQVSLNEAMILCALQEASPNNMTATSLSKRTELTPSHASKMLRILEEKELIVRTLGEEDRRLMQFHLSQSGKKLVRQLALEKVEIPELLKPLFESVDSKIKQPDICNIGLQKNKTVNRLFIYYRLFTVSRFVILQATL